MQLSTKKICVLVGVSVILGGIVGWFGRPEEVREVHSVRVVEKEVVRYKNDVVTRRTIETKPDGSSRTTETIVDKSQAEKEAGKELVSVKELTKKTLKARTEIIGGVGVTGGGKPSFVLGANRQLLGPFSVGILVSGQRDAGIKTTSIFGILSFRF